MKKNMFLSTCFSIFFTHAMEQPDKFSMVLYGTTIDLSTKFLSNIVNINLFVAGYHDQALLGRSPNINMEYRSGIIHHRDNIYWKNKEDENYYRDDTREFFEEENRPKKKRLNIFKQKASVIVVTEPCITLKGWYNTQLPNTLIPIPHYQVSRFDTQQNMWLPKAFEKDQAISEASKDLTLCYEKILEQGICFESKSIAIPTLGADVGFPRDKAVPIALTAITSFLMYNQNKYQRIKLWVKKRSEFVAYTTFLMNYWKKPCILYCAHKDENHFLYDVPGDVINYILQLMHVEQD